MPDQRIQPDPNEPMTTFKTDSPEEQKIKLAVKNMAVRFYVELEQPLLRTNAPARQGNRATIVDLDLDKLINHLDENKFRSMMHPGSMQEMLWQIGDLPGAVIPTEHEVFLEFEAPQPPAACAGRAGAAGHGDSLAPLKMANGALEVGPAIDITNNPGYDNQPSFTPDGKAILFTSVRGGSTASGSAPSIAPGQAPRRRPRQAGHRQTSTSTKSRHERSRESRTLPRVSTRRP